MIYLGVFATASATLILEVALTRLFSVAFWYHFAFLVISIALLGFGASGTRKLRGVAAFCRVPLERFVICVFQMIGRLLCRV
ncbi:MAG: hypothetical protein AABY44_08890 [Nitrospirota bacterium]